MCICKFANRAIRLLGIPFYRQHFSAFYGIDTNRLALLEKHHTPFEAHLSGSTKNSINFLVECSNGQDINDKIRNFLTIENGKETVVKLDCTIETFLFHDDYLRRQHVTILCVAFRKCAEILGVSFIFWSIIELSNYSISQYNICNEGY